MAQTSKGAYCSQCQIEVIEFRGKLNDEVKNLLCENTQKKIGVEDFSKIKLKTLMEIRKIKS